MEMADLFIYLFELDRKDQIEKIRVIPGNCSDIKSYLLKKMIKTYFKILYTFMPDFCMNVNVYSKICLEKHISCGGIVNDFYVHFFLFYIF